MPCFMLLGILIGLNAEWGLGRRMGTGKPVVIACMHLVVSSTIDYIYLYAMA